MNQDELLAAVDRNTREILAEIDRMAEVHAEEIEGWARTFTNAAGALRQIQEILVDGTDTERAAAVSGLGTIIEVLDRSAALALTRAAADQN